MGITLAQVDLGETARYKMLVLHREGLPAFITSNTTLIFNAG